MSSFEEERDLEEGKLIKHAYRCGEKDAFKCTDEAFQSAKRLTKKWLSSILSNPIKSSNGFLFNRYWQQQNRKANLV